MWKTAVINPWMWKEAWFTNNEKRGTPLFYPEFNYRRKVGDAYEIHFCKTA